MKKFKIKGNFIILFLFFVTAVLFVVGSLLIKKDDAALATVSANADYIEDENEEYEFIEIPLNIPCSWQVGYSSAICAVRGPTLLYNCFTGQIVAYCPAYVSAGDFEHYIVIDRANTAFYDDFFVGYCVGSTPLGSSGVYIFPQNEFALRALKVENISLWVTDDSQSSFCFSIVVTYSNSTVVRCDFEVPQYGYYSSLNELLYSNVSVGSYCLVSSSMLDYNYILGCSNGYDEGYFVGEKIGYNLGYADGESDGFTEGEVFGYDEGYTIGYDEGVAYSKYGFFKFGLVSLSLEEVFNRDDELIADSANYSFGYRDLTFTEGGIDFNNLHNLISYDAAYNWNKTYLTFEFSDPIEYRKFLLLGNGVSTSFFTTVNVNTNSGVIAANWLFDDSRGAYYLDLPTRNGENLLIESFSFWFGGGRDGFGFSLFDGDDSYFSGYTNGYNKGFSSGKSEGYNDGYSEGRDFGYNEGLNYTGKSELGDAVSSFVFSLFDAPINSFMSVFNFEVAGFNIGALVAFIFSLVIIFAVLKLVGI